MPWPTQLSGYANYLACLDSSLNAEWILASNYITFDWHPKVAVYGDQVFFLSHDFEPGASLTGRLLLKAYTPEGIPVWRDSLSDGSSLVDYQHFALEPFCDRLLLEFSAAGGMAVRAYAETFQDSLLGQTSAGGFEASFPFICTNGNKAVFGSNFRHAELAVGDDFILKNDKAPGYQQFLLEFDCPEQPSNVAAPEEAADWSLAPNPAGEAVYLYRRSGQGADGARLELFDAAGRRRWSGTAGEERITVPLSPLPAGLYILQVAEPGRTSTLKIVKQ